VGRGGIRISPTADRSKVKSSSRKVATANPRIDTDAQTAAFGPCLRAGHAQR
jgi:hypothetical protein